MAPKAGLSYNNDPFLTGAVSGVPADPFLPATPSMPASSATGVGSLGSSAADQAALAGGFLSRSRASLADLMAPPRQAPTPVIGVSAAGDELYVQGRRFTADDAQAALEAEATLGGAPVGQLPAGFRQLDPGTYAQYTQIIRNPSRGELAAKGFGRGIDSLQMLAGRGAQLLGAEEFGARTVKQQVEDLRKTEPYARQFTDIQSTDDAIDWFVATLGEQGPMLLESVAAGIAGAAAGGATGGPLAAVGGAVAGLVGKTAWKNSVLAAARKRAAGEVLDATQAKLLRNAAAISGATGANVTNSLALGASDIYGELRDQGADADDVVARLTAVAGSLPYAALDLLPEFALASRIFGTGGRAAIAAGTSLPKRGAELLRRVGTGTVAGGATEGATEAGQEALLLGLSDQDFSKPENVQRLINSFAAGFAVGAPLGGLANLKGRKAADVLQGGNPDQMLALPAPPLALPAPAAPPALALPAPSTLALPAPQGRLPDYSAPAGELPLAGGTGVAPSPAVGPAPAQGEMFPVAGLGEAPVAGTDQQIELPFAQGTERPQIQDVLPLETGLPPRFFAQPAASGGTLADNPVLRAMQQRAAAAPVAAERQAAFEAAQQAVTAQQEAARVPTVELRRGQTLQQIQPELLAAETAIPSPELGTTPEQATTAWTTYATGPGRRKAFAKFLPEIQAQWIDALNMASVGELTEDNLRTIRVELVKAENAARLTKTAPVTVVTGAITPTPPPPGGKGRALKKPEAAEVPPAEQPGTSGEAIERPAAGRGTAGASTAQPKTEAETKVEPVPPKPRETVPDVKAAKAAKAAKKPRLSPREEREALETIAERIDSAIEYVETGKSKSDIDEALYELVDAAFFASVGSGPAEQAAAKKARDYVVDSFTDSFLGPRLEAQFVNLAVDATSLSASETNGSPRPWLQFALDNDLIDTQVLRPDEMPARTIRAAGKGKVKNIARLKDDTIREAATEAFAVKVQPVQTKAPKPNLKLLAPDVSLSKLIRFMADYMKRGRLAANWDSSFVFEGETYSYGPRGFAEDMYAEINPTDAAAEIMGVPIREYFNVDGSLRLVESSRIVSGGTEFVTLRIGTAEDAKRGPATATVGTTLVKGKKGEQAPPNEVADTRAPTAAQVGKFKLSDFNTPDRADPAIGKLRMAITRFVSRLATKPKVSVFRNQADMKAKNPKLYQQAIASRPEGDFATAVAAGFSFGDGNVVIFTDRIANEQHLNFVLAHETIGHFGLRGIIPAAQFNAVMDAIYNASPAIKADVDAAVANGMPRAEAVEEYLSDFAAVLDTSVVARVWNAIKGALNKLGVKFGDEMVRYTLKHARSYVRTGKPSIFDAAKVFGDLYATEHGQGYVSTGRFSTVGDLYADNQSAELVRDTVGGTPTDFEAAWGAIKGLTGNNIDRFDRLKAEFLSLANFRSRLNPGLNRLEEVLEAARNLTSSIRVSSNEQNAEVFNTAVFGKYFGTTDEQVATISKLMYDTQRMAVSKIKDIRTLKGAPLYDFKDGVLTPNQPEIDKLTKQGMVDFAQARDGFTYTVPLPDGTTRTEKFGGIPGLTEDSIEWRGYVSLRTTVNNVELQLLRARYQSLFEDQNIAFKQFDELVETKRLTTAERELLRRITKTYKDIYTADITFDERGYPRLNADAMGSGNDFIIAVNKTLIPAGGKDSDFAAVAAFFEGKAADDIVAQLRAFRARLKLGEGNKFTIQTRIKQVMLLEVSNSEADLYTRRTLATGYTPVLREGQFQVRVEATNPRTGKIVRLADAYRERLIYSQVEAQSEAEGIAKGINDIFGDKTYEVEAYSPDANEFTMQTVVLRAVPETSLDAIAGPPELNLNEFAYGLRQLDIALTPKEVEKVVTALTRQNSAARNRLLRAFTPGADPDAIRAVARHIDSRASTIAKVIMRPQLAELMNLSMESTQRLWNGDAKLLADLKAMSKDTNLTPDERALATREYERYKFMYEQTNPAGKPKRANQFYNEASRTVAFLNDNRSVTESNFETGKIAARIRATTSIMQLGGSIATGALNLISAYTNGLPFLASYNPSNGFGGGFGMGPSVAAFHVAMKQVGALGMTNLKANTAEFYDAITKSTDLQTQYGLKAHEAAFIAQEIREGAMIPAQTNALLNTARGQTSSGFLRKFIDGWMLPFNLTEQASRRTLGLAAYRLEYSRQTSAGVSDKKASESARRFAVEALNLTMGEYSVLNRPPAWRGGIQSFLYMYKVFPTTSIQLFSNLSRNGKIAMLASLWMLSGLQGLPFAEDLEDLIDTLAQALGFKSGSIRMEVAKFLDDIFPGMSPFFMQGLVNRAVPADIGGRVSLGNVIPGSGILLSGADVGRELTDIAGPAPSAIIGSVGFFANLMRVPFSERISLIDLAREAPVTMMRAVGDTVAYAEADAIVNRKGSIVDDDVSAGVLAARLLGFYPAAAAEQYSVIRIGNRVTDYQRDVVAGFRAAWIKAKIADDNAGAREIEDAVAEWNKGAKGTGLQIADFRGRSQRALKEAQRPAKERTLRTVPKAGREDIERTFDILSY